VSPLDKVSAWIRGMLAFLPSGAADFLWFPLLAFAVFLAAMLSVRRLMPLVGMLAGALLRLLSALVGAVLLALDLAVATACRSAHRPPPAALYHYGDVVVGSMIAVARTSGAVTTGLARLARVNTFLVMLGCAVVIGAWNHGYCSDSPATTECVRPFDSWVDTFSRDDPAPPDPANPSVPSAPPAR
jgi:hypothetical protein